MDGSERGSGGSIVVNDDGLTLLLEIGAFFVSLPFPSSVAKMLLSFERVFLSLVSMVLDFLTESANESDVMQLDMVEVFVRLAYLQFFK